jgi:hypothetical protein
MTLSNGNSFARGGTTERGAGIVERLLQASQDRR